MTQDDVVAPSELHATTSAADSPRVEGALRVLVYCVAAAAAVVMVWALIRGGDREAWTRAGLLAPVFLSGA